MSFEDNTYKPHTFRQETIDAFELKVQVLGRNVSIDWTQTLTDKSGNRKVHITCTIDGNICYRNLNDLVRGKYDCSVCVLRRWSSIATSKNFTLIERVGKSKCRLKCLVCGEMEDRTISSLLSTSGIKCKSCECLKYANKCTELGFTYLSHSLKGGYTYVNYRCGVCSSEISNAGNCLLFRSTAHCQVCFENKLKSSAAKKNWTFVGRTSDLLNTVRCQVCSAERTVSSNLLNSDAGIPCYGCREERYRNAISQKGCLFIGLGKSPEGRLVVDYLDLEGVKRQTDSDCALGGHFRTTSAQNHWEVPYEVYFVTLVFNGTVYNKIGIAQYSPLRLKKLELVGDYTVDILHKFPDRYGATNLEKFLHCQFAEQRANPSEVALFSRKRIFRNNKTIVDGVTEWFTDLSLDNIKSKVGEYLAH